MLVKKESIPLLHMILVGLLPSFIKIMVYRLRGYKIDKSVSVAFGAVVIGKKVSIGSFSKVGMFTIIRADEIAIGRHVTIGSMSVMDTGKIFIDDDARVNEQVYVGGMKTPESEIRLGKRTIVMQMSYLNPTLPIHVGDDSGIGGHCLLFTHASWNSMLDGFPVKFAPIKIGRKVWLPWRVFIMPGAEIGDEVVIAANSLVNGIIPRNTLAAGSPAKVIRENFPQKPDNKERDNMVNHILGEFCRYLVYNAYQADLSSALHGVVLKIAGKKNAKIHYVSSADKFVVSGSEDVYVLLNGNNDDLKSLLKRGAGMAVTLSENVRAGSNDAGEELLRFFSRYGVRFGRID
ncbi:MAG: acyltransferase [Bacteroidetes bacterium]|nr:MAG: acyltransferase [Bacteroidota bacterium]